MKTENERSSSLIFCITICLLLGGVALYDLRLSFLQEKEKMYVQVANTSFLIGEWIKAGFAVSDYVLKDIVYSISIPELKLPATDIDNHARVSKYIVDKQQTVPNSNGIGLTDKNCIVTHTPSVVGFDASKREWCSALMNNPEIKTYISNMFLSNTGELMVIQGRVFPGEDFNGQAAIGIDLHFFSKWLEQMNTGPHSVLAISDENISLLARKPAKPEMLGKKVNDTIVETFIASGENYKTFSQSSPLDGENRLYGVRKVDGLPFIILVGEADRDWQADWVRRAWVTAVTVVILWSMAVFILRNYWDRLKNLAELKKARDSLKELSLTDSLTGLANRRRFDDFLDLECRHMRRNNGPLSVVMIDIDYFKAFNDTYGHLEGDKCLQNVSEVIKKMIKRPHDLASRYGGEEFCCILPETEHSAAVAIAMSIKDGIVAMELHHEGSTIADHVTASLGVATAICDQDIIPESIVSLADKRLYLAKESGRNRV